MFHGESRGRVSWPEWTSSQTAKFIQIDNTFSNVEFFSPLFRAKQQRSSGLRSGRHPRAGVAWKTMCWESSRQKELSDLSTSLCPQRWAACAGPTAHIVRLVKSSKPCGSSSRDAGHPVAPNDSEPGVPVQENAVRWLPYK